MDIQPLKLGKKNLKPLSFGVIGIKVLFLLLEYKIMRYGVYHNIWCNHDGYISSRSWILLTGCQKLQLTSQANLSMENPKACCISSPFWTWPNKLSLLFTVNNWKELGSQNIFVNPVKKLEKQIWETESEERILFRIRNQKR